MEREVSCDGFHYESGRFVEDTFDNLGSACDSKRKRFEAIAMTGQLEVRLIVIKNRKLLRFVGIIYDGIDAHRVNICADHEQHDQQQGHFRARRAYSMSQSDPDVMPQAVKVIAIELH